MNQSNLKDLAGIFRGWPRCQSRKSASHRRKSSLRFSPTAWAKLLYWRDRGPTEVGAFGITRPTDDLWIEDLRLVRQECTEVSVAFDDEGVADFFDAEVDRGRAPAEFGRVWIHTHPAASADPSSTDEETFARCFGNAAWSVMFILARGGQTFARLSFHVGPGGSMSLPVEVDFSGGFPAADPNQWEEEYLANVNVADAPLPWPMERVDDEPDFDWLDWPLPYSLEPDQETFRRSHDVECDDRDEPL